MKPLKKLLPEIYYEKRSMLQLFEHEKYSVEQIKKYTDEIYFEKNNRHINWDNPLSYTEKLNVAKIFRSDSTKTMLSDKIQVRDWITNKIGEKYLVPIIGVYDTAKDISYSSLPDQFVIKCNHDSGSTTVVDSKDLYDEKAWKRLSNKYDRFYLKRKFAYKYFEMQYKDIVPKVIVEQYMGHSIQDYKFLCFNGVPYYCWVDVDRFTNHKRNIYDLNWKLQPFNQMTYGNSIDPVSKPANFSEMLDIVKTLCIGFDHVRIDLYEIDNRVYFGEMTFTNGSGFEIIHPTEWDYKLGELWQL